MIGNPPGSIPEFPTATDTARRTSGLPSSRRTANMTGRRSNCPVAANAYAGQPASLLTRSSVAPTTAASRPMPAIAAMSPRQRSQGRSAGPGRPARPRGQRQTAMAGLARWRSGWPTRSARSPSALRCRPEPPRMREPCRRRRRHRPRPRQPPARESPPQPQRHPHWSVAPAAAPNREPAPPARGCAAAVARRESGSRSRRMQRAGLPRCGLAGPLTSLVALAEHAGQDVARLGLDPGEVAGPAERLCVQLVHVLGARRARREPA